MKKDDDYAVISDRLWFRANPNRTYRLRPRFRYEGVMWGKWKPDHWVCVMKISESWRSRMLCVAKQRLTRDLLDDDAFCGDAFFGAVGTSQREFQDMVTRIHLGNATRH